MWYVEINTSILIWKYQLLQNKLIWNHIFFSDWSILYVIIALLSLVVCWVGLIWGLVCLCQRICIGKRRSLRTKKKPPRYSLLQPEPEDESNTCMIFFLIEFQNNIDWWNFMIIFSCYFFFSFNSQNGTIWIRYGFWWYLIWTSQSEK